jgi:hypothetical protein
MAGKETNVAGIYQEAGHEEDGLTVALPNGSGWNIHVDENGNIEVTGPLILVS